MTPHRGFTLIALLLVLLYTVFQGGVGRSGMSQISYSDFLKAVDSGQVASQKSIKQRIADEELNVVMIDRSRDDPNADPLRLPVTAMIPLRW